MLGTRPEIIKLASVIRPLGGNARIIDTGQHYDAAMSGCFFEAFRLPAPDVRLHGVGGASRGQQVGAMICALTELFADDPPRAVVVQGDTNTASAAAQAASYSGIPVVHVEAGLRSHDRAMPEEINRQVVGVVAELHCAPTPRAAGNLAAEGVPAHRIRVTGNTIVEATGESLPAKATSLAQLATYGVDDGGFVLATIHRPENTDDPGRLRLILDQLATLGLPVVFPVHPRTRERAARYGLEHLLDRLQVVAPADHPAFLGLARHARLLVSDSGGVQEECTVLKKPLLVVRNSTERPEAVEAGFATLLRPGPELGRAARELLADATLAARLAAIPSPFGDGRAGERIAAATLELLGGHASEAVEPAGATPKAGVAHSVA
jgi:UDP-N-acetylglucosamine 2-epimerase (non-hydrolysing)